MLLYSFESSVHVVFKAHLTFTSNLIQRGVIAKKTHSTLYLENHAFWVITEKILEVWMTITHKGKGLITKIMWFFKNTGNFLFYRHRNFAFCPTGSWENWVWSFVSHIYELTKKLMYPDFHFCKFYFQTSNSFFSSSNLPKCKISGPII